MYTGSSSDVPVFKNGVIQITKCSYPKRRCKSYTQLVVDLRSTDQSHWSERYVASLHYLGMYPWSYVVPYLKLKGGGGGEDIKHG